MEQRNVEDGRVGDVLIATNQICDRLVESGKRIAIYGAGSHTLFLFQKTRLLKANLVAIIDRDKRHGDSCWGLPVCYPEQITNLVADAVLISVPKAQDEIRKALQAQLPSSVEIIVPYTSTETVNEAIKAVQSAITPLGVTLAGRSPTLSDKDRYGRYHGIIQILDKLGYAESVSTKVPCDAKGLPLPWYTYPAIAFLRQFALGDCSVFEWGCGNSSLFYAARCRSVRSIDIAAQWVERVRQNAPDNLAIHHRPVAEFPACIGEFGESYDIIVIDAERRLDCARESVKYIKPGGLIIVDNADNSPETCALLRTEGLLQIDFTGFGPVCPYRWTTSLFFKGDCMPLQQPRSQDEPVYGLTRSLDYYEDEAAITRTMVTAASPAPDPTIIASGTVSYAQEGEDILIDKILRRLVNGRKGFYVDVGANDPVRHSLTYNLYKQGWHGINIEPRPESKALFDRIRPRDINIETGVSDVTGNLDFHLFELSVYNTFDDDLARQFAKASKPIGIRRLPVQRLDTLLEKHMPEGQPIDLLSIDVEGFELNVLKSSDWQRYRPLLVALEVLEYDLANGPGQAAPVAFMLDHGYRFLAKTENTLFFAEAARYSLFTTPAD
ncbi:MAG TPA: hypothetical protein DCS43_03855 [Verrucomicrobia bacterium]|nr:hypothetical protein [Verrucomicrobiota bacterium]